MSRRSKSAFFLKKHKVLRCLRKVDKLIAMPSMLLKQDYFPVFQTHVKAEFDYTENTCLCPLPCSK